MLVNDHKADISGVHRTTAVVLVSGNTLLHREHISLKISVLVMDSSRLVPLGFQRTDSKQLLFKRVLRFSIFPIAFVLNVFNRFFKRALPQKKTKQLFAEKMQEWHCVINSTCSVNLLFLLFTHSSSNCKTFLCSFGYSCPLRLWPLIN